MHAHAALTLSPDTNPLSNFQDLFLIGNNRFPLSEFGILFLAFDSRTAPNAVSPCCWSSRAGDVRNIGSLLPCAGTLHLNGQVKIFWVANSR